MEITKFSHFLSMSPLQVRRTSGSHVWWRASAVGSRIQIRSATPEIVLWKHAERPIVFRRSREYLEASPFSANVSLFLLSSKPTFALSDSPTRFMTKKMTSFVYFFVLLGIKSRPEHPASSSWSTAVKRNVNFSKIMRANKPNLFGLIRSVNTNVRKLPYGCPSNLDGCL